MGSMGEIFRENKEFIMQRRQERSEHFIPLLKKIGAIEKSDGVWQIGEFFCYPTKGFAMHRKTYKKKNLSKFIEKIFQEGFTPAETDKVYSKEKEGVYAVELKATCRVETKPK